MSTTEEKAFAKGRGDRAFAAQNYAEATEYYAQALVLDPANAVLYSNRSAAFASLGKYAEALEDAERAIKLKPDWARGYARKGLALFYLGDIHEALESYSQGHAIEPDNPHIKRSLEVLESLADRQDHPFATLLNDNNLVKLMTHPRTAAFFQAQDFHDMINAIRACPDTVSSYTSDPRLNEVVSVLIGTDIFSEQKEAAKPLIAPHITAAEAEKELGNTAYKQKQFEDALAHYSNAHQLNPANATYLTNMSAVYFEQKDYQKCVQKCEEAIAVEKNHGADSQQMSRLLARQGDAYMKLGKIDAGIDLLDKSLFEHSDDRVKTKLKLAKERRTNRDTAEKLNLEAEEANSEANFHFNHKKYAKARDVYAHAIQCNPQTSKFWLNRSACHLKLGDLDSALSDVSQCLVLEPENTKVLFRKGLILAKMGQMEEVETVLRRIELLEGEQEAAVKRGKLQVYVQGTGEKLSLSSN